MSQDKSNITYISEDYYRPHWTCGRYNAQKKVAIVFNLLSRMNYFFEAESAEVIDRVLTAGRGGNVNVTKISDELGISENSIKIFFDELCNIGLLSKESITDTIIDEYRTICKSLETPPSIGAQRNENPTDVIQSAYHAFTNAVSDSTILTDVMFELTYCCQANCIHCYNPGAIRNKNEVNGRNKIEVLTLTDYKRIIDDLCANGLTSATITGGDPFMYPFVWQIIEYLYQNDIAISIYTNGIGLAGKEKRLAAYYPYKVQCSLYSGNPDVHDRITTKKGSWMSTVSVMENLHKYGVPIEIACPIMQPNLKTYFGVKPYMRKFGSRLAFDVMLTDSIDGDKCVSHQLRLTPEQLSIVLLDEDVIQHINLDKANETENDDLDFLNGAPCGVLKNSYCLNPNGDLTPCCAFHKILGNLKHNTITEVFNNNDFIKQWEKIKESDYGDCFKHEYCLYCYFCPGNNYNDKKECLNGGENNCYLAKVRYDTAMRYHGGEDLLHGKSIEERICELDIKHSSLHREY